MQVRRVRVSVETERLRVVGTIQMPTEGYRSRSTDFLSAHETGFIALTDAEIFPVDGSEPTKHPFVAVLQHDFSRRLAIEFVSLRCSVRFEDAP